MTSDDPTTAEPDETSRSLVVIIDDYAANVALLQRMLARRDDLEIIAESDGELGLELIRRRRPGLVLLDLNLPTLNGDDILRQVRSTPATARTPIVILSGDANPIVSQRLLDAGADAYITKPFQLRTILDLVARYVPPG